MATKSATATVDNVLSQLAPLPQNGASEIGTQVSELVAEDSPPETAPAPAARAPAVFPAPAPPPPPATRLPQPRKAVMAARPRPLPMPTIQARQPQLRDMLRKDHDTLQVYRVDQDNRATEILGREYPAEYLIALGLDFHTFVLRHVVPDFGGGDYLIRAISGADGSTLAEQRVKVAGSPKSPGAQPQQGGTGEYFDAFGRAVQLGRGTLPAGDKPKSMAEALVEIQSLEAIERMSGKGKADLERKVYELESRIASQASAASILSAPVQPTLAERLMEKQLLGGGNEDKFAMLFAKLEDRLARMEDKSKEDFFTKMLERQDKLIEKFTVGSGGIGGFKAQLTEAKELAEILSPPSQGGFMDVIGQALESWNPEAIADMVERTTGAQLRAKIAERQAGGGRGRQPQAQRQQAAPQLAKFVPVEARKALATAKEDADVVVAALQVVGKLLEVKEMRPAVGALLGALARGDDVGDRAAYSQVGKMIELIYGRSAAAGNLAKRVAEVLIDNREDVIEAVAQYVPADVMAFAKKVQDAPGKDGKPSQKKVAAKKPRAPRKVKAAPAAPLEEKEKDDAKVPDPQASGAAQEGAGPVDGVAPSAP